MSRSGGDGDSELFEQALEIFEFEGGAGVFAEAAAQFLEDFAGALHVDLIGHLDASARIGAVGSAGRAAQRVERTTWRICSTLALAHALLTLAHHLFGHRARALAQLIKGAGFGLGGAIEIAFAEGFFGFAHGLAGFAELAGGIDALTAHALLQTAEHIAQRLLTVA